jgi:Bifunctional DNA primase/polymerase, N-terminal
MKEKALAQLKRLANFVASKDLREAAYLVLGTNDDMAIAIAMRKPETRNRIRAAQYRLGLEASRKAKTNPPARDQSATGGRMDQLRQRDDHAGTMTSASPQQYPRSAAELDAGQYRQAWATAYTSFRSADFPAGLALLVVGAARRPLTEHGVYDATTDINIIANWLQRWPFADLALAVPETVVVADLDEKNRKHGLADFERLDGRDPRVVETPQAISPSGGMHLFFAAHQTYPNAVAIKGTGVDIRTRGGYVVLPCSDNGRHWLKPLGATPLEPAPTWLASALQKPLRPALDLKPITSRKGALAVLEHALARIIGAPAGEQENTRHAQCFKIGALIAEGVLDYATARSALVAAAEAMPAYREPWRDLEAKIDASLERGMREAS